MKMATHYQQCSTMIYKSSLPGHSAKQCVHLSCNGSTLLYFNHFRSLDMSAQGQGDQVCVQGYLGNSLRTIGELNSSVPVKYLIAK
ncbi:hypothetical protein Bpfe_030314 [Biomphalaria pfeifferi]|uniref:Uncharacterized protein n=1 Tax=Biomphalaria pfeifferi TaxID=112525 RepID=A0AAD8AR27_BIOPF|nr:hypothetical protein Bpfe_030314 [Biomphalaria pfeifferi]